jgi:putative heme-binding domain-containing protein
VEKVIVIRFALWIVCLVGCLSVAQLFAQEKEKEDPFRTQVRPTDPLSPDEQQKTFHLPPGFEIQLFSAEPDLQKPMNMAFDAAGRLWVSASVEYPYAASEGGRDTIKILEDADGDGRADKVTTFVDGLNIPIGLYPYRDGVVAYSIPNIWFFRDTDGDGKADQRDILYGPLGTPRDTHGMQNAFRRGFDGWLYINHGFSNESTITAQDGSSIKLQSGNTYRVRLDGSHVEQYTWGQVNPFGSTFLPTGELITADCHSRPLTMLLRGAYYPSFGKPHDGLGFAPDLMEHSHGSTAIGGVAHYTGDNFPAEYQGHLFVGNVMTSRVNHDSLQYRGSTPRAIEQPDFLSTDDPWFRPVDVQIGPDGALYVADFYNRIIGHYEVALDHPGRDRNRGRIWRITYRDPAAQPSAAPKVDLSQADVHQLIETLAHPSLTRRMLATDQLSDRIGEEAVPALIEATSRHAKDTVRAHCMWVLHRLGKLSEDMARRASRDDSELVRIHALRALSETVWPIELRFVGEDEPSPIVRRVAAEGIGHQTGHRVDQLLKLNSSVAQDDVLLRHATRLAIRNQLLVPEAWQGVVGIEGRGRDELARLAVSIPGEASAEFLLAYLRERPMLSRQMESQLSHLAVNLAAEKLPAVIQMAREKTGDDVDLHLKLVQLFNQRTEQREIRDRAALIDWSKELANSLLRTTDEPDSHWQNQSAANPWGLEPRDCEDGESGVLFLSSLPGGESLTATIKSREFVIPPKLTFYLCGHLGIPSQQANEKNFVQLRLAGSGDVIQRALPPRNDRAQRVDWELMKYAGQKGYLEVVDGLELTAYAWLAVARFDPPVVALPVVSPAKRTERQAMACTIVGGMKLAEFRPDLFRLAGDTSIDWPLRAAAGRAALMFVENRVLAALAILIAEPSLDPRLREGICQQIVAEPPGDSKKLLSDVMKSVPARAQRQLADALASTAAGAAELVQLVEQGHAAPRLLQDGNIKQKLSAAKDEALDARIAKVTASLPTVADQIQRTIDLRRLAFRPAEVDVARGQEMFRKHCIACHQVAGQGAVLGPQLDGIGNRGLDRLMEDTLDPNRNVDIAFHVSVLSLTNGQVVTGLFRREEGANVILANQEGKEFTVLKSDIDEQTKSSNSLMPANVADLLKPDEFRDLIGYLLTLRAKQ